MDQLAVFLFEFLFVVLPLIVDEGLSYQFEFNLGRPNLLVCDQAEVWVPMSLFDLFPSLNHLPGLFRCELLIGHYQEHALGLPLRASSAPEHLVNCISLETGAVRHNYTVAVLRHL